MEGIVEMPKCMIYWPDKTRFGQPPSNLINCKKYIFYVNGNKTLKTDDNSDYDA